MRAVIKGAIATALIAGSSLAGTAPAQARDHTGTAIIAGIIGLGVGAAIASDHRDRYDNYGYGYQTAPAGYYDSAPAYGYSYGYQQPYVTGGYYSYDRGYRHHRRHDRDDRRDYNRYDRDRDYRDGNRW